MNRASSAPSPFFAFRTPLLPFETIEALGAGMKAPAAVEKEEGLAAAVEADVEAQRSRLCDLVARPAVREAIFLASPDLEAAIGAWLADPASEKGRRAERALVKYAMRMASRATPFGLFAGTAVGRIGKTTKLEVGVRAKLGRRSRLDADWLFAVADSFGRDDGLRTELTFLPNSSLYAAGRRWRYVESRSRGDEKSYQLVSVDDSPEIRAVLARAERGARWDELAEAVVGDEVSPEEAEAFVSELVEAQVLVPVTGLVLTGPDSVAALAGTLRRAPSTATAAALLERATGNLERFDSTGFGVEPSRYRALAADLSGFPVEPAVSRLFQVDLVDTASVATLGERVVDEMGRGLAVLHRIMPPRGNDLRDFVEAFGERWGLREVPLAEALDEESGLGYPVFAEEDSSEGPLLEGLPFPDAPAGTARWGSREAHLLRLLTSALSAGLHEIVLSDEDVETLANPSPAPLPGAFAALVKVAAASPEALEGGDFKIVFESAGGPSGARFLGRFCHADPELERLTMEHLRAEEALDPDAVFAEIVHLPEGRSGNVVRRPLYREYEIPYLGESGAPDGKRIPIADLLVSIRAGKIVLRSRRLGKRVVPRQTAAHNYVAYGLGIYRFLCALQAESTAGGILWGWGALATAPFLPRVRRGRTILAAARWNLGKDEIARLASPPTVAERFCAVASWRAERRVPRFALVADLAEELLVDLDAVLSVESFLHLAKGTERLELKEMLPGPGELCARGAEGRFVHEALVPYVGTPVRREAPSSSPSALKASGRTFAPGSEWLYLKLYGGNATLDRLVRERVGPLAASILADGGSDRWFFVRYADPRPHLRLRFHGEPARLRGEVLHTLLADAEALLDEGLVWRVQADTYEREVERYGGAEGMVLAEEAFHADSEAVVELLGLLEDGAGGEEERWRLALLGVDSLLADLGFALPARIGLVGGLRRAYGLEHREDAGLRRALSGVSRARVRDVEGLLARDRRAVEPLELGLEVLKKRSGRLVPVVKGFQRLSDAGLLGQSIEGIAASLIHMHLNRVFASNTTRLELVVYELLQAGYKARAGRAASEAQVAEHVRPKRSDP